MRVFDTCFFSNPMHTQFTVNVHISGRPLCVQLLYIVYTRFKQHSNYVHQLVVLNIMTTLSYSCLSTAD